MQKRKRPSPKSIGFLLVMGIAAVAAKFGKAESLLHSITAQSRDPHRKQKPFSAYQPSTHDVFVCTYAKSGTNWAMQIAQQIAYYGTAEFDNIYDLIPWPEMALPADIAQLNDPKPQQQSPSGLRVIKTHLESDFVPYNPASKYILVVRDPKDVFVSSYYFGKVMLQMLKVNYTAAEWFQEFMSERFFFDSWPAHTASYWPWRERENVLLLTFRSMKHDLRAACQQIADLMQVDLTADQLDRVVEKSSFQYMQAIDQKFMPQFSTFGFYERPVVVRSGKSGVSDALLNKEQQAQLDAYCRSELKRLGSDFPYDLMFTQKEGSELL